VGSFSAARLVLSEDNYLASCEGSSSKEVEEAKDGSQWECHQECGSGLNDRRFSTILRKHQ
jgi:hypothetical protein